MSTKEEENDLYNKLVSFKQERDYLLNIYQEVDSLIRRGYDGPFMGEDIRDMFEAVNKYKCWKNDTIKE